MRYGDLLAKMARNEALSPGEVEQIRLWGNNEENALSRATTIAGQSGGLNPDVFQNSGQFSVLPHDCGSLFMHSGSSFSLPDNTWTEVPFSAAGASIWKHGIDFSSSGANYDGFDFKNKGNGEVWDFQAWGVFPANSSGDRGVRLLISDGGAATTLVPAAAGETDVPFYHRRKVPTDHSTYKLQLFQNSGAPMLIDAFGALFTAARIR